MLHEGNTFQVKVAKAAGIIPVSLFARGFREPLHGPGGAAIVVVPMVIGAPGTGINQIAQYFHFWNRPSNGAVQSGVHFAENELPAGR